MVGGSAEVRAGDPGGLVGGDAARHEVLLERPRERRIPSIPDASERGEVRDAAPDGDEVRGFQVTIGQSLPLAPPFDEMSRALAVVFAVLVRIGERDELRPVVPLDEATRAKVCHGLAHVGLGLRHHAREHRRPADDAHDAW